jgi:S-adenosylmethionine/arginine decarboxylase-like enzyme
MDDDLLADPLPGNVIDGLHLIVDGSTADVTLYAEHNLTEMFHDLVSTMDMSIIVPPFFKDVELDPKLLTGDRFRDEGGISGLCMVNTSHLAIHCWPLRNAFMFDASSCKRFDPDKAVKVLSSYLKPTRLRVHRIIRRP